MTRMAITLFLLLTASTAFADVLILDGVREVEKMDLPVNGLSMDEVAARYGEPASKGEPVGEPPITRWEYEGYSVFFEHDLVLFSVLNPGAVLDKS